MTATAAILSLALASCTSSTSSNGGGSSSPTQSAPPSVPPTTRALAGEAHVDVSGYSIAVSCQGASKAGAPMVMLLTGMGDPYTRYKATQQQLRGSVRVCAYDRPGEGTSSKPTGPVTLEDDIKLLHGVLDAVGAGSRVVLVGHSIGGLVAAGYAHAYQQQVTGLLLLDATPPAIVHEILGYIPARATGIAAEARGEMKSAITTKNPNASNMARAHWVARVDTVDCRLSRQAGLFGGAQVWCEDRAVLDRRAESLGQAVLTQ